MYSRVNSNLLEDRLDAEFYSLEQIKNHKTLQDYGVIPLSAYCNGINVGYTGELTSVYRAQGTTLFRVSDIDGIFLSNDDVNYVPDDFAANNPQIWIRDNDIVFAAVGNTIGKVALKTVSMPDGVCSRALMIARPLTDKIDSSFLIAYLATKYAQKSLLRGVSGSAQPVLNTPLIANLPVISAESVSQKYIGDKVRQAEQLRAWAKRLALSIEDLLTSSDDYLSACRTPEKKITRPQLSDLSNRLDPKYYGNKAIAVHRFTRKTGTPLAALIKSVANGFEERSFIENGLAYITVSEVSSGRLDAQSAPKISKSIDVPQKAVIHETCVLVVRTGSIGTAVKVHALDKGCAISSHLIRLEFEDEETAAAVAVFLNSSAGKVLLHKISYGAVQPQIGQEELLALNIPEYVLNEKTQCLALLNSYELAIRASKSLTVSAKNLVEALIEGQLTEQQLIQAQQALEDGDNSLDQAILSKLSAEGYAIEGATPLFSDVDELYSLLEEAAQAEAEE
ncbi:restriction endonuclease subunit S [Escherichia coli]|uniref:restriction endonuclease subunit S n=1 Tax=Escherichia coli TaxID=562 RepID=UPI000C335E7A|nr:restriction endonuclease subunit S [Escherichia coli]EFK8586999.1 restriction endonuclease subunit S [Escherichia coli]EFK8660748.1 restriction endonuclease subunit S [Escherichia coli]PKE89859.1 restriction endonuclease [Escherichia coli]PLB76610.1 restriction endonuclease [Escherichia coli]PWD26869.1 restriction endonuclease subunit S [Escherichia coli]